jgi:hypothetical protein
MLGLCQKGNNAQFRIRIGGFPELVNHQCPVYAADSSSDSASLPTRKTNWLLN